MTRLSEVRWTERAYALAFWVCFIATCVVFDVGMWLLAPSV